MQSGFQALSLLSVDSTALFLDFDGTLALLVDRPENVRLEGPALENLELAFGKLGGALAIVTGRDLASLDLFLAPHVFPASGVHGFESRSGDGRIERLPADLDALARVKNILAAYASRNDGLLLETKPASIALHYRLRPELARDCERIAADALSGETGLNVMHGKMVIEIKAHAGNKGHAISAFLDEPPYKTRTPVFIGDDVTDEAAFAVINARSGISIKVGAGETVARYRLADPDAVHEWLSQFIAGGNRQVQTEGAMT